ncbi:NAD(P)H-binding protein [Dyella subtropica]|uniref:NmrA family NAD(P)-binding protein n=1 Tax=Dyella subtropica TaxID=2992127 RepID=UPI002254399E|nr:NAD(P)H-binding protein [Dyella subtropica]
MITVMGATGHTGARLVELLLKAGERVRALGRSESRLAAMAEIGAEVCVGEPTDARFLAEAFDGASAVYTLLAYDMQTPNYHAMQNAQGVAILHALRESGTRHVVFHSSVGAELPSSTGPIASLHAHEARLRGTGDINALVLRTGALFENFYGALEPIRQLGMYGDAMAPDVAIPMIATRDLADAAAKALIARDWQGFVVRELLGPRDLSYTEATRMLGESIGRSDLIYTQLSYEDTVAVLREAGFSEDMAGLYVELTQAINQGRVHSLEGRNPANTTPTSFETFAQDWALAYGA